MDRVTARFRRKNQAFFVAALALSAGVFAACAIAEQGDGAQGGGGAISDDGSDASADADAIAAPRRVCPTTTLPDGGWLKVDGIDTSDYEFADWDAIHANQPNLQFSFLRVSASLVRVDTRFHFDWPEVKRVGMLRGAYQYLSPRFSAVAQADLFLQRLTEEGGLLATDLPPVLDVETTNDLPNEAVACKIKIWLSKVENALVRVPMIYASWNWSALFTPEMTRYPLWVPNYVATPSVTCPRMPDPWATWNIWQYGESSGVQGLYSNADRDDGGGGIAVDEAGAPVAAGSDMNYFNGTRADLDALITSSVSPGPVAAPPLPANPPHVATPDGGPPPDCTDGCCVNDP